MNVKIISTLIMYLSCISFSFIFSWIQQNIGRGLLQKRLLLLIACIPFSVQSMLRGDLGSDTRGYRNYYSYRSDLGPFEFPDYDIYGFEIGFDLLTRLAILLNFNFELYQGAIALIMSFLIISFFQKYTSYYAECYIVLICMFVFFSFYNIQRQCLAIIVFYYGISSPIKIKKYALLVLSCSIHFALIPIALLYFLYEKMRFFKINDFVLALLLVNFLLLIVLGFSQILPQTMYAGYLVKLGISNIGPNLGIGSSLVLIYNFLAGWIIWKHTTQRSFLRFMGFSWILIYLLFSSNPYMLRFGLSFQFAMIALVAIILSGPVGGTRYLDKLAFCLFSILIFSFFMMNNSSEVLYING